MTLNELKEQILNGAVDNDFKIFVYDDNTFLVKQYIEEICQLQNRLKNKINSIYETESSALSLVMNFDNYLNIIETDTFEERSEDYSQFENIIVVCKKVDKKLETVLSNYIVEFPKLEDWQIKAYMQTLCPAISPDEIDWLYTASKGDIYKILNEIDKILLFDKSEQHDILNAMRYDKNTDLYQIEIFDIADAIVKQDKLVLLDFLKHEQNFNFDPIAISNLILNTLKKIALIKLNSGATATDIGVSAKQYNAFKKYLFNNVSSERLFNMLEFISGIDIQLKSSLLSLSKDKLLDYIICKSAI